MKIYVDIDETICARNPEGWDDYAKSIPLPSRIAKVNKLYDDGHEIHYWTARGTVTGQDHFELTFMQLLGWGCKFHRFNVGKTSL